LESDIIRVDFVDDTVAHSSSMTSLHISNNIYWFIWILHFSYYLKRVRMFTCLMGIGNL